MIRVLRPTLVPSSLLLIVAVMRIAVAEPCRIEVIDSGNGWPVPLVELRTTNNVRFVTDNAGVIAFDLPEVMGRELWFDVIGHGYERARDGFGFRGVRLTPRPGARLKVEVTRTNLAKRLGRLTGAGLFAESQKLGAETDWQESGVYGCDSVQLAEHRGKLFWAWGDTRLPQYPLGIFDMLGATTAAQPLQAFEPPVRMTFDYFRDAAGRPRPIAKMPGTGPTWLTGYVSLPDQRGEAHLVAAYMKVRNHLEAYEWGLCVWDEAANRFTPLRVIWTKSEASPKPPPLPEGHPAFWTDEHGKKWVLFGNPLPKLRCPARFESWQDAAQWEVLPAVESLESALDGKPVQLHSGSMAWNEFRQRWVTVFMQRFGEPSAFGELWYAEARQPTGPWGRAIKVLTHDNYTFYNPRLHPELVPARSPILLFEGTYTREFAKSPPATPRYDYNQILYRLDLDDPALAAAQKN